MLVRLVDALEDVDVLDRGVAGLDLAWRQDPEDGRSRLTDRADRQLHSAS